jgi:hypothetical protein
MPQVFAVKITQGDTRMVSKEFVTAGNAIFTVKSVTGQYYTYRVNRKDNTWFISLLTGPDNTSSYTYLGLLDTASGGVILTKKSGFEFDSLPVKVLRWALGKVWSGSTVPEGYSIMHEGRCGRCNRLLTVPSSLESGLGPECEKLAMV